VFCECVEGHDEGIYRLSLLLPAQVKLSDVDTLAVIYGFQQLL
jgi:hypothetical protein